MNSKNKSIIMLTIFVIIIVILAYLGFNGATIGNYRVKSLGETIKRGLDLQGGVSVLLEIAEEGKVDRDKINQTKTLLESRINKIGVSETEVLLEGEKRFRVNIPGKFDSNTVIQTLSTTGELTFVDPDGNVILTGKEVKNATAGLDNNNRPVVKLELNEAGTQKFKDATQKFLNQKISIKMDEDVLVAPTVEAVITDGNAVITGSQSLEEAKNRASIIQSGALPVTLKTEAVKTVGATLGKSAVPDSLKAGAIGIFLVFLLMIFNYRIPGILSCVALSAFILLVLYIFNLIGVVLTLPGIAAFLLTVGMAVDANVLIFERIKEEYKIGKPVRSSIEEGFKQAMSSIVDSNLTTIIAALILYLLGSGPVKGFAITLLIGVLVSMFTAITVTRNLMKLGYNMGILKHDWQFGVKRGVKNA